MASMDDLVSQSYSLFRDMPTNTCQQFMQIIQYPIFIISLLDKSLADTNNSLVPKEYKPYRNSKHKPLDVKKVFNYVFKTLPNNASSLKSIYHHVTIVSKYCMCVFSTLNYTIRKESRTALPEDHLELLITSQFAVTKEWETLIESLLTPFNQAENLDFIETIRWSMKLTILTITEYF
jgi:hypothetical protein